MYDWLMSSLYLAIKFDFKFPVFASKLIIAPLTTSSSNLNIPLTITRLFALTILISEPLPSQPTSLMNIISSQSLLNPNSTLFPLIVHPIYIESSSMTILLHLRLLSGDCYSTVKLSEVIEPSATAKEMREWSVKKHQMRDWKRVQVWTEVLHEEKSRDQWCVSVSWSNEMT